jgi:hypothetical protein
MLNLGLFLSIQPHLLETFDDTFNEAISQLVVWGNVLTGEDGECVNFLSLVGGVV